MSSKCHVYVLLNSAERAVDSHVFFELTGNIPMVPEFLPLSANILDNPDASLTSTIIIWALIVHRETKFWMEISGKVMSRRG